MNAVQKQFQEFLQWPKRREIGYLGGDWNAWFQRLRCSDQYALRQQWAGLSPEEVGKFVEWLAQELTPDGLYIAFPGLLEAFQDQSVGLTAHQKELQSAFTQHIDVPWEDRAAVCGVFVGAGQGKAEDVKPVRAFMVPRLGRKAPPKAYALNFTPDQRCEDAMDRAVQACLWLFAWWRILPLLTGCLLGNQVHHWPALLPAFAGLRWAPCWAKLIREYAIYVQVEGYESRIEGPSIYGSAFVAILLALESLPKDVRPPQIPLPVQEFIDAVKREAGKFAISADGTKGGWLLAVGDEGTKEAAMGEAGMKWRIFPRHCERTGSRERQQIENASPESVKNSMATQPRLLQASAPVRVRRYRHVWGMILDVGGLWHWNGFAFNTVACFLLFLVVACLWPQPPAGPLTLEPVGEPVPALLVASGRVHSEAGNQIVALRKDGQMIVYDRLRRPLAQWSVGQPGENPTLALVPKGNGLQDICIANTGSPRVCIYDGRGRLLNTFLTPPHEPPWTHAAVLGVDDAHGGGTPQIFVRWEQFGGPGNVDRLLATYAADRPDPLWVWPWGALGLMSVAGGNLNGDGRREYVVDNDACGNGCEPKKDGKVQGPDSHAFLLILNDRGEPFIPPRSLSGSFSAILARVADLDGDRRDEVVLLTRPAREMAEPRSALRVLRVVRETQRSAWVAREVACREYRGVALTSLEVALRTKTRPAKILVGDRDGRLHVFDEQLRELQSIPCSQSEVSIIAIGNFDADESWEALVQEYAGPALLVVDDWDTGSGAYYRIMVGKAGEQFAQVVLADLTGKGELSALVVLSRPTEDGKTDSYLRRWQFAQPLIAPDGTSEDRSPNLGHYDVSDERAQPLHYSAVPWIHDTEAWAWSPSGKFRSCVTEGECVGINAQGRSQHRWPVPQAEWNQLRWSPSEARLALLGTPEEAPGPVVLAVCDVRTGMVQTREVPDHFGLNLAWLPGEESVVVQLGRLVQDPQGNKFSESAGLWRWTFATDQWEPLTVPGLQKAAYLLADTLEQGPYAFFDPTTATLLIGPLAGGSRVPLFDPQQVTDLLIAADALLNPLRDRQNWLTKGDRLVFAILPDLQGRQIAGAVAPDGRRLAVPLMMLHQEAVRPRYLHYILCDLWLFAAGEVPRQLTYRNDLNLRHPAWDPTGRLIAVEARRLDRLEPITEIWIVRVTDRQMFYVGPGEQPQWDPRQSGRHLAFLRDGVICGATIPPEWFDGNAPR